MSLPKRWVEFGDAQDREFKLLRLGAAHTTPPPQPRPPDGPRARAVRALLLAISRTTLMFALRVHNPQPIDGKTWLLDTRLRHFRVLPYMGRMEFTGPYDLDAGRAPQRYLMEPLHCDLTAHVPMCDNGWYTPWQLLVNSATFVHNARRLRAHLHAADAAFALLAPLKYCDPAHPRLPRVLVELVLRFLSPSPRALESLLLPVSH